MEESNKTSDALMFLKTSKWFQKMATGIVCLFFFLMLVVTCIAYMKPSRSTGMDAVSMHKQRVDSQLPQRKK